MKMRKLLLSITMACLVSGTAIASEIYKWVDADGNVHYGDKPVMGVSERVAIESRRTDPQRVAAETAALIERREARREAAAEAADADQVAADARAAAEEKKQKCSTYRQQLQAAVNARRLYQEDEAGERTYLDENESIAARQRMEDQVNEYCNG